MTNIYTFLRNVFQDIKHENKINPTFGFVILILIAIPMLLILSSVFVGILVIITAYFLKKSDFNLNKKLLLPILLYLLMVVSLFWTIDVSRTVSSLVKELPLLIIPLCFLCFKPFSENQKQKIIQYYSYAIVAFSVFYLIKAAIRYTISHDSSVFFYHELVTKEVNAIHVSVYVAIAFFYFFTKKSIKKPFDYVVLILLFILVFLLSSKNIIVVFVGLMVAYHLFYSKLSKQMRLKNLLIVVAVLLLLPFVGKIKERFQQEYQTIMVDNSVNDVINKNGTVYNVSIKQAWTQEKFEPNNFFPGTAFRVYQLRIFLELMQENNIFWNGFGLDASYKKIEQKGIDKNVYLGVGVDDGYQKKNFHNQYVQNFAELGIFGFLILIAMLFVNLKNGIGNKNFIQIAFGVIMISLFLTETFLWRQRGVMFFTLMYCIFNSDVKRNFSKTKETKK